MPELAGAPTALFCGPLPNDAGNLYCDPHAEICCIGGTLGTGFADSMCNAFGTACTNGMSPHEFDCEDPVDCPVPGSICCFGGTQVELAPSCGYDYAHTTGSYSRCVLPDAGTTCAAGEEQVCTSRAQCAGVIGKPNCTPFKVIYFGLGHCTP